MKVILTHKIALKPTVKQLALLVRAVGTARFAYNWALSEWQNQYRNNGKPSDAALRRQLNAIKHVQFPWMLEVPKSVVQQAVKNLGKAFSGFFKKRTKYPRFHKRGQRDSARFDNGPGTFQCVGEAIRLPVVGWIKTREKLRFDGKPLSATVSRTADKWYVSIPVEVEVTPPVREKQAAVGVDFGLTWFAVLSTGAFVEPLKPLKQSLKKLQRLSRRVSRKKKGSANRYKAVKRLARLHSRISNLRQDFLHRFTTALYRDFSVVGIEDLAVSNMIRNHKLARSIADVGWGEAKRQLTYKAILRGAELIVHGRWFASSKTCSACGHVLGTLPLHIREWSCPACQVKHDRDLNAAKNLKPTTVSCTESYACGEDSAGYRRKSKVKLASKKQESALYRLVQK